MLKLNPERKIDNQIYDGSYIWNSDIVLSKPDNKNSNSQMIDTIIIYNLCFFNEVINLYEIFDHMSSVTDDLNSRKT